MVTGGGWLCSGDLLGGAISRVWLGGCERGVGLWGLSGCGWRC